MKVEYNSILDDMQEIIQNAELTQRRVKYIELSRSEWFEYKREMLKPFPALIEPDLTQFLGVSIRMKGES